MTTIVKKEYYRMVGTAAIHAISTLGKDLVKDQDPIVLDYAGKRVEIRTTSENPVRLSLPSKKLLDYILLLTTYDNPGDWPNDKVYFTLKDYMRIMGYENTRQMRNKCFAMVCEDIAKLGTIRIKQDSGDWFGLADGHYRFVSYKSTEHSKKNVVAGLACFEVGIPPGLLEHIKRDGNIIPFMGALFSSVQKSENAYAVMKRMIWHSSTSLSFRTKYRPRVSTLLACCSDRSSQVSYKARRTFERTMTLLAASDGPSIQWCYFHKSKRYTIAEITAMRLPHKDWLNIFVECKPIGLSPKMNFADPSDLNAASQAILVNGDKYVEEYVDECMEDELDSWPFTP